jgi:hypothetical protein
MTGRGSAWKLPSVAGAAATAALLATTLVAPGPVERSTSDAVTAMSLGPRVAAAAVWSDVAAQEYPSRRQAMSVPYDAKFTFTRIRYASGRGGRRGWGRGSAWNHDWPAADRNMQTMLNEFTAMRATTHGSNVFELEDPEIFRYPILYVSEPGTWGITPEGAANLREHLLKGGFLIFDDFEYDDFYHMAEQVAQALPEGSWVEIDETHPIFSTFFYIEDIYVPHPLVWVTPSYKVLFEDNDPTKRVMVLANHNSDLAEYWEYAAQGYFPVDPTNDAFRLGINYLIYGVTH